MIDFTVLSPLTSMFSPSATSSIISFIAELSIDLILFLLKYSLIIVSIFVLLASVNSMFCIFLNSSVDTNCDKNRIFSTFDFFPTTLASLGAEIDGERLGLGTNLFSCKETLGEIYGNSYINENVDKTSEFYDDNLM